MAVVLEIVLLECESCYCRWCDNHCHAVCARIGESMLSSDVHRILSARTDPQPKLAVSEQDAMDALLFVGTAVESPLNRLLRVAALSDAWLRSESLEGFSRSADAAIAHLTNGFLLPRLFQLLGVQRGYQSFVLGIPILERSIAELLGGGARSELSLVI